MKKISIFIFSIFVLISCNTENSNSKKNNRYKKILVVTKKLKIPIDSNTLSYSFRNQVITMNNTNYLIRKNNIKNRLEFFNLDTVTKHFYINISRAGKYNIGVADFTYISKDSIFIKELYRPEFVQFNINAEYIKKYKLKLTSDGYLSQFERYMDFYDKGIFYMALLPMINYKENPEKYCKDNIAIYYNFKLNKLSIQNVHFPLSYKNDIYPNSHFFRCYNFRTKKMIYSWCYDANLYVANKDSIIEKHIAKSSFIKKIPHFNRKKYKGAIKRARAIFSNNMYLHIIYDRYKNVYYRFVPLKGDISEIPPNFNIPNEFFYRPFSVMLIDSAFNVVDEIKLPPKIYHYYDFFVDKHGLWISENNPENPEFDENFLSFRLITFDKKKLSAK